MKITNRQLSVMKKCWQELELFTTFYYNQIVLLRDRMERETRIKGIQFEHNPLADGIWFGIGTKDKKMKLYLDIDLKK